MEGEVYDKCGGGLVVLKQSLEYYEDPHILWKILNVMLIKLRNRGQDGAGVSIANPNYYRKDHDREYMFRERFAGPDPAKRLEERINGIIERKPDEFIGTAGLAHCRWGTEGEFDLRSTHPARSHSGFPSMLTDVWMNGNHDNNWEQRRNLTATGRPPRNTSDTIAVVTSLNHYAGQELEKRRREFGTDFEKIERHFDYVNIMKEAYKFWSGGWLLAGITGSGVGFACVDPKKIRPAYVYEDKDFLIVCSETYPLEPALGIPAEKMRRMQGGEMVVARSMEKTRKVVFSTYVENKDKDLTPRPCPFEYDYFSRPYSANPDRESKPFKNRGKKTIREITDENIISEMRKRIGAQLAEPLLTEIKKSGKTLEDNFVLSFIPDTGEEGAKGLVEEINNITREHYELTRVFKKDTVIRTYVEQSKKKKKAIKHSYDPYRSRIRNKNVVLVDDSIVEGNTLKQEVIGKLIQCGANDIYVLSTFPIIKYPCSYGVSMSIIQKFASYKAVMQLAEEKGLEEEISKLETKAIEEERKFKKLFNRSLKEPHLKEKVRNYQFQGFLKDMYVMFTDEDISDKIAEMVTPTKEQLGKLGKSDWKGKVHIIYQTTSGLIKGVGDDNICMGCYEGKFPTAGGYRVSNTALVNAVREIDKFPY